MENTGQKRVLSFEEFMEKGEGSEMGSSDQPMFVQDEQPMDNDTDINLEKEPEQGGLGLAMMDEPQQMEEEPQADQPENEEPSADESAEFWSLD